MYNGLVGKLSPEMKIEVKKSRKGREKTGVDHVKMRAKWTYCKVAKVKIFLSSAPVEEGAPIQISM